MENKTSKYFKYAIGEIILVVIGILIALQINNWNENRKLNNNEKIILIDLVEDLELDYKAFTEDKKNLHRQLKLVDELIIDPYNSTLAKTDINFIRYLVYIYPVTFEDNIPEGINNKEIIEVLKNYYRYQQVALRDNVTYSNVVLNLIRPYLRKNAIHIPKKAVINIEDYGKNILDISKLEKLYDTDEFGQILFELRVKTAELIEDIENLMKLNKELVPVINNHINDM
ncbi:MAG: hypothetical protein EVB12_03000 [Winogradskyella sp.]|uniref:DUF6090 family protein n=1 Tax=Winogradskyella sp. TaxID=1883156 RepID=UPI0011FAACDE|nr:DUF6090 family protein [Winogradskyella sp.]RZN82372.1 MAG: hypothetical protein EVB12_03000 [Winogradskyella sp.]